MVAAQVQDIASWIVTELPTSSKWNGWEDTIFSLSYLHAHPPPLYTGIVMWFIEADQS